jgi:hypothetical protein
MWAWIKKWWADIWAPVLPSSPEGPGQAPRIVEGVVVSASKFQDRNLGLEVENAMAQAVRDALASGVSINDTERIRAAMLAARVRVLKARRG